MRGSERHGGTNLEKPEAPVVAEASVGNAGGGEEVRTDERVTANNKKCEQDWWMSSLGRVQRTNKNEDLTAEVSDVHRVEKKKGDCIRRHLCTTLIFR